MRSSTFIFFDENIVSSLGIQWSHIAAILEEKQTPEYLARNGLHYKDMLDILSLCINKALCIIVCRVFLLEKQKFKWHHEHWTHPSAMWETASSEVFFVSSLKMLMCAQDIPKVCPKYVESMPLDILEDMPKQGDFNCGPPSHPNLRIISSESGCQAFVENRDKCSTKTLFLILLNLCTLAFYSPF